MPVLLLFCLVLIVGVASPASAAVFDNRELFESQLDAKIIDDYELPAYSDGGDLGGRSTTHSDSEINAIIDETRYRPTGFPGLNRILRLDDGNHFYCAGCNGSYELDFTMTSIGTPGGVFGVGLDLIPSEPLNGTIAYVTYGDGTTENITVSESTGFWGIVSTELIATIHFGGLDGATSTSVFNMRMAMDNLTIGTPVPESAGLAIAVLAAAPAVWRRRSALEISR